VGVFTPPPVKISLSHIDVYTAGGEIYGSLNKFMQHSDLEDFQYAEIGVSCILEILSNNL